MHVSTSDKLSVLRIEPWQAPPFPAVLSPGESVSTPGASLCRSIYYFFSLRRSSRLLSSSSSSAARPHEADPSPAIFTLYR